jgi:hypothetical protein
VTPATEVLHEVSKIMIWYVYIQRKSVYSTKLILFKVDWKSGK